ncbi:M28 family peptidase [candidate division KSB1 bacterium]|nr:M28 family peptidase [candidate division KSB1 bacterium]MBL7093075.1 M28 family peptidase [candidate division KSB1 bacterium]
MSFLNNKSSKITDDALTILQENLIDHVNHLSEVIGPRNLDYYSSLNKASQYISQKMIEYGAEPVLQNYKCKGKLVNNIIAEKKGARFPDEIIIVGGHYDSVMDSPGADDNGTAIAALIELIRLLKDFPNQRTVRFVAFTLEEPPHFGSGKMGSLVYAKSCYKKKENIIAMIALEMLGYFTDEPMSQQYPFPEMLMAYPERGNFIAVVGNKQSEELTNKFADLLKETSLIKTETLIADASVPGVDLSDHASFWRYNYPALMITDTAFYRNPYYHTTEDKIDFLNFKVFAKLVYGLAFAIKKLNESQ